VLEDPYGHLQRHAIKKFMSIEELQVNMIEKYTKDKKIMLLLTCLR